MTDFKIRGTCEACYKTRWFIRKRQVKLPIGQIATSQKLFCNKCSKGLKRL